MRTISALRAAGHSDTGMHREVNEDRFCCDPSRGVFMVVDGVGGQAAGGKAADIALTMVRTRLERETGPVANRVREAITIANNEIHRAASLRPEWRGMACVLTVAVVDERRAIVGHVGDTRLYKLRDGVIEKVTRDHSPVGEREDSNELSEFAAMHHPRRNEVYRDVGSEPHEAADPEFIDLHEIPFEPDAALLLCSDGLTDLVESAAIHEVVQRLAGQPDQVVKALVEAANHAGGKDNVTVVYVEGEGCERRAVVRDESGPSDKTDEAHDADTRPTGARRRRIVRIALMSLLVALIIALAAIQWRPSLPWWRLLAAPVASDPVVVVRATGSIAAALERAQAGSQVVVEPGEYRERLVLKTGVRVVSRVPRGATIRLPGSASEGDPAVIAAGVSGAELAGFRIVGDAATPLGTGLLVKDAELAVVDIEVTGAVTVAIDLTDHSRVGVTGSDIHDNPGAALAIRSGASSRIVHNVFARNGMSERVGAALVIEPETQPRFSGNVFHGIGPSAFGALSAAARAALARDNWFPDSPDPRTTPSSRDRQGR